MFLKRSALSSKAGIKFRQAVQNVLLAVLVLGFLALAPVVVIQLRERSGNAERREIQAMFEAGQFESAYAASRYMLTSRPLDFFLLAVNGFAAYQVGISQMNRHDTLSYINSSIWSLRKAMLLREGTGDGRIYYVLGKAYYHKGPAHADLAVFYLERALASGFMASDIPEYLGLAHASLNDFRGSVNAFALALSDESRSPSDVLLLSIARSYLRLGEMEQAEYFLNRCLEVSRDSRTRIAAGLLRGYIFNQAGEIDRAYAEFLRIIDEDGEDAEVIYQIGALYAAMGDITRARAEWRRALRVDPTHSQARSRLL